RARSPTSPATWVSTSSSSGRSTPRPRAHRSRSPSSSTRYASEGSPPCSASRRSRRPPWSRSPAPPGRPSPGRSTWTRSPTPTARSPPTRHCSSTISTSSRKDSRHHERVPRYRRVGPSRRRPRRGRRRSHHRPRTHPRPRGRVPAGPPRQRDGPAGPERLRQVLAAARAAGAGPAGTREGPDPRAAGPERPAVGPGRHGGPVRRDRRAVPRLGPRRGDAGSPPVHGGVATPLGRGPGRCRGVPRPRRPGRDRQAPDRRTVRGAASPRPARPVSRPGGRSARARRVGQRHGRRQRGGLRGGPACPRLAGADGAGVDPPPRHARPPGRLGGPARRPPRRARDGGRDHDAGHARHAPRRPPGRGPGRIGGRLVIDLLMAPMAYDFMWRGLLVVVAASVAGARLGCWLVHMGWALMGDAVSHAVLPGVVIASMAGMPFAIGALLAALVAVALIGGVREAGTVREDAAMGIVFTTLFSLGMVLISRFPSQQDLHTILFGSLLGVGDRELVQVLVVAAFTVIVLLVFR